MSSLWTIHVEFDAAWLLETSTFFIRSLNTHHSSGRPYRRIIHVSLQPLELHILHCPGHVSRSASARLDSLLCRGCYSWNTGDSLNSASWDMK